VTSDGGRGLGNETGTEVAVSTVSAGKDEEESKPIPRINADHPFLFIIRDNPTGHILFMGRLTQP
jgi:serpin B